MNRNQKIALGCGGAGCLGLIVIVVVCAILIVSGTIKAPGLYDPGPSSNYNYNSNRNSNYNSSSNRNTNTNSSSSTSMSSDDQHKLYQAAGTSKDTALMQRVIVKLGLTDADAHQAFVKDHFAWALKNFEFIQSINSPEKAKEYVDEHFDD